MSLVIDRSIHLVTVHILIDSPSLLEGLGSLTMKSAVVSEALMVDSCLIEVNHLMKRLIGERTFLLC